MVTFPTVYSVLNLHTKSYIYESTYFAALNRLKHAFMQQPHFLIAELLPLMRMQLFYTVLTASCKSAAAAAAAAVVARAVAAVAAVTRSA
jgi:hypothetical protein